MARERVDVDVNMSDGPTKRALMTRIGTLQGLYSLDLKPIRPTRSSQQNRFYWGVLVKSFVDANRDQNVLVSSEATSLMFKVKCAGEVEVVPNPLTGEVLTEAFKSTAEYTVEEMTAFIERIIAFLGTECGIEIVGDYGVSAPHREGSHA